jgi:hypothetical protein
MALGIAALGWWFAYPHARFKYEANGDHVVFEARPGLGYVERWDFDSDGHFDTSWASNTKQTVHEYEAGDTRSAMVRVEQVDFQVETIGEFRMNKGDEQVLASRFLKLVGPRSSLPPAIRFTPTGIVFRPNGAAWTKSGEAIHSEEVAWQYGEPLELGNLRLKVFREVCATLEVKGPLGLVGHAKKRIVLELKEPAQGLEAAKEASL